MKRLLLAAALLATLATTSAALGAGPAPITENVLGAAGISKPYTIPVTKPADVVVARATVPPGASFGWHYHRARSRRGHVWHAHALRQRRPALHPTALLGRAGLHRAPPPRPPRPQRGS